MGYGHTDEAMRFRAGQMHTTYFQLPQSPHTQFIIIFIYRTARVNMHLDSFVERSVVVPVEKFTIFIMFRHVSTVLDETLEMPTTNNNIADH